MDVQKEIQRRFLLQDEYMGTNKPINKVEPFVSVSVATYQHKNYIKDCLDSILNQQTNFKFEIIVGEDESTDGTREICIKYAEKYPDKIRLFLRDRKLSQLYDKGGNLIKRLNGVLTFGQMSCRGKYVALCEGDDYWTDPLKLQKQVAILEKHSNINICSHPSFRLYGKDLKMNGYGYWGEYPHIIPINQVIKNYANNAPLQSILFRRTEHSSDLIKITSKLLGGHSSLQIFYAIENGIYYLPDYMSVYRVNSSSSISKILFRDDKDYLKRQLKNWKGLDLLNEYSNYKFNKAFEESKKLRAIHSIKTGYLTIPQIIYLTFKFKLFKTPKRLRDSLRIGLKQKFKVN